MWTSLTHNERGEQMKWTMKPLNWILSIQFVCAVPPVPSYINAGVAQPVREFPHVKRFLPARIAASDRISMNYLYTYERNHVLPEYYILNTCILSLNEISSSHLLKMFEIWWFALLWQLISFQDENVWERCPKILFVACFFLLFCLMLKNVK